MISSMDRRWLLQKRKELDRLIDSEIEIQTWDIYKFFVIINDLQKEIWQLKRRKSS